MISFLMVALHGFCFYPCWAKEFQILLQIQAGYDLAHWRIQLTDDGVPIESLEGSGDFLQAHTFDLQDIGLEKVGSYSQIVADAEVVDKKGQVCKTAARASVKFIRRKERVAQKMGYKVLEKYALILFDFNSAEIKQRNRAVLDRIIERIREVPNARVRIVGKTDTIGKEACNLDLSKRRAKAAYDQILAGDATASSRINYEGEGPTIPSMTIVYLKAGL
jgi:outer membrane protein OmpA-like peptidoglycan-associated protein